MVSVTRTIGHILSIKKCHPVESEPVTSAYTKEYAFLGNCIVPLLENPAILSHPPKLINRKHVDPMHSQEFTKWFHLYDAVGSR
jgi:hypothetical protein